MLRRRRREVKANALILASVQEPHFSRRNCSTGVYTCNRWVTSRMGAFSPVWSRDVLKEFAWAAIQCFRNLHNVFQTNIPLTTLDAPEESSVDGSFIRQGLL